MTTFYNRVVSRVTRYLKGLATFLYRGRKKYYCPICDKKQRDFLPFGMHYWEKLDVHGFIFSEHQFETLNLMHYVCPYCKESDRARLYFIYWQKYFQALDKSKKYKFIDFAPSRALSAALRSYPFLEYRTANVTKPVSMTALILPSFHAMKIIRLIFLYVHIFLSM